MLKSSNSAMNSFSWQPVRSCTPQQVVVRYGSAINLAISVLSAFLLMGRATLLSLCGATLPLIVLHHTELGQQLFEQNKVMRGENETLQDQNRALTDEVQALRTV